MYMHMVQSTFHIKKRFLRVYISGLQMVNLHQMKHSFSCKVHTNCTNLNYIHHWNSLLS